MFKCVGVDVCDFIFLLISSVSEESLEQKLLLSLVICLTVKMASVTLNQFFHTDSFFCVCDKRDIHHCSVWAQ